MLLAKFLAVEAELNTAVLERETEIRGLIVGAVAKRHVYMLGEPGVAKSYTISAFVQRIRGASIFDTLMTRTTLPPQIFGPPDLTALKAGVYKNVSKGKLQEAHFAFLDEVFKANSAILNALLRVLNERLYDDGGNPTKVPLISCVSASNELPQGEDLNAMYDRLHLRYVVRRIQEDANLDKLLTMGTVPIVATIDLAEVEQAQREAGAVKVGPVALDSLKSIRVTLDRDGIRVSDRRLRELVAVCQAEAWLNGHSEIEAGDLAILQHGLWSVPEERKKVLEAVYSVSCPNMPKALEQLDLVLEQYRIAKSDKAQLSEAVTKVAEADNKIKSLAKANGTTGSAEFARLLAKSKSIRRELAVLMAGGEI
jgi:MoxR-like ATPase